MANTTFANTAAVARAGAVSFLLSITTYGTVADAAELNVLSSVALKAVITELAPQFEQATGHKLAIEFGASAALKRQIDGGKSFDVAILKSALIDALIKQRKIAADTRTDIARSGMGVIVSSGAFRPDINSYDSFKRTLVAAKSIGYTDPTLGDFAEFYIAGLLERLGIASEVRPKTKLTTNAHTLAEAIAGGRIEIGLTQISEIVTERGVQLVGPFPPGLQNFSVFTAGMFATSKEPEACKTLIEFLGSPAALQLIKDKGMAPGSNIKRSESQKTHLGGR